MYRLVESQLIKAKWKRSTDCLEWPLGEINLPNVVNDTRIHNGADLYILWKGDLARNHNEPALQYPENHLYGPNIRYLILLVVPVGMIASFPTKVLVNPTETWALPALLATAAAFYL